MKLILFFNKKTKRIKIHPEESELNDLFEIEVPYSKQSEYYARPVGYDWFYQDGSIVLLEIAEEKSQLHTSAIQQEIGEIESWLFENDWIINKIILGEWTKDDQRYINYIEERLLKRKRHAELEKKLNI